MARLPKVRTAPPWTKGTTSLGLRRYLHATVMLTGAAILVLEIIGARMLTPFFGSSHFVWSAQITVTMLALAAGYHLGGRMAGWEWGPSRLFLAILGAALYLVATVAFRIRLATECLGLSLPLGSTVAAFALFFIPLSLLATAGPVVVRLLTQSLSDVGPQVGRLTALGTVGSVLGVLLASYVLIPNVGDSLALLATAAALGVWVAGYFVGWGVGLGRAGAAAVVVLASFAAVPWALSRDQIPIWPGYHEIARANSHFGLLQVIESNDHRRRFYLNDFLIQNSFDLETHQSASVFTEMLAGLSYIYTPQLRRALCLGMGVGLVPMRLARDGVRVDVVEINPAAIPLARDYFDFDSSRVRLVVDDARHFLTIDTNRYNTIHLDAFVGDAVPSHLMSQEAFLAVRNHLATDGTLVINTISTLEPGRDFLATSLYKTLGSVFRHVVVHAAANGNIFFVASDREPLAQLREPNFSQTHPLRRAEVEATYVNQIQLTSDRGSLLTDDFNPIDYRDAPNREELRRRLVRLAVGI